MKCKYFNIEYNILRNQLMGLKHILSIVTYTDKSKFCTVYRSTYRKTRSDSSEENVTNRHLQLYFYSRHLIIRSHRILWEFNAIKYDSIPWIKLCNEFF